MSNVHHNINGDCALIGCPQCKERTDTFIVAPLYTHYECQSKLAEALEQADKLAEILDLYNETFQGHGRAAQEVLDLYRKWKKGE